MTIKYSVYIARTNQSQEFTDPQEAGAAFFNADRTERPSVIQSQDDSNAPGGRFGRMMADTEVHGAYDNGELRFVKALPSSHPGDDKFREGYWAALERSVNDRLKNTDWEKARPDQLIQPPKLHPHLADDLEALANLNKDKAINAWRTHAPAAVAAPAYAAPLPYAVDVKRADGVSVATWNFQTQEAALQRFKDAATEFQAAKPAPGASVALNGPDLASSGGYVSEGKGSAAVKFHSDELRARFDSVPVSPAEQRSDLLNARGREVLRGSSFNTSMQPMTLDQADLDRVAAVRARDTERARGSLGLDADRSGDQRSESLVSAASTAKIDTAGKAVEVRAGDGHTERLATTEQAAEFAEKNSLSGSDRQKLMQMDAEAARGGAAAAGAGGAPGEAGDDKGKKAERDGEEDPLAKRFLRTEKGYLDKTTHTLAIEDKGTKLLTDRDDAYIIESMLLAAKARGWKSVAISGSPEFKREAWLQAEAQGLGTTGYSPSRDDFQRLEAYKADRAREAAQADPTQRTDSAPTPARQESERGVAAAAGAVLVAHGTAKYLHDEKNTDSYFVTTRDSRGAERTTWGVDLERAVADSGAKIGDRVVLNNEGQKLVTVTVPVHDKQGVVIGSEEKQTHRNAWNVAVANLPQDRRQIANTIEKMAAQAGVSGAALDRARNEIARVATSAKSVKPVKVVDPSVRAPQPAIVPPKTKTRDFQR